MTLPTTANESLPMPAPALLNPEEVPGKPFRAFIVNTASRCDLDCPECPVYHLEDTGFSDQPKFTPAEVLDRTAAAIEEYVERHGMSNSDYAVQLFGGESTLGGARRMESTLDTFRKHLGETASIGITTNGIQLGKDPELRKSLQGVRVGISLDGHQALNDKYRTHHRSRRNTGTQGTFDEIAHAIRTWNEENPSNRAGLLATIHDPNDPDNDPVQVYETLANFEPRAMDFLLNHGEEGARRPIANFYDITDETDASVGDWLIAAYTAYRRNSDPKKAPVRLFKAIESLLQGNNPGSGVVGMTIDDVISIASNGMLELDVAYKGAYDGAANTGISIFDDDPFGLAERHPLIVGTHRGIKGLSATCQSCPIVDKCGGGSPYHRFWHEPSSNTILSEVARLYDWPSRFCADLGKLILHVANTEEPPDNPRLRERITRMPQWPPSSNSLAIRGIQRQAARQSQ